MEENAMNKRNALVLVLLASLVLPACSLRAASAPMVGINPQLNSAMGGADVSREAVGAPAEQLASYGGGLAGPATTVERMVVRNATLSLVVSDPRASVDEIAQLAQEMGGYVVSSNVYSSTFGVAAVVADQGSITIRVPVERLDEAVSRIEEGATEVRTENVSGEDVTATYTDLASQLRNYQAAEEQLREILASATRTEDVMLIFNQLTQVRGQIEMIQGQMRYYEESARLSAISVDLIPDIAEQPIQIAGWHPEGVAKDAIEDLIHGLQSLVNVLIRFGICGIPFLVIFGLPAWLVIRAIVRRRRAKKAAAEAAAQ
jgi:hypothetical protein